MKNIFFLGLGFAKLISFQSSTLAQTIPDVVVFSETQEILQDFSSNPLSNGWSVVGSENLFTWNRKNEHLEVTWDSSVKNSYFQIPLNTVLSRSDSFRVDLDLYLNDILGGVFPGKPGPMQLAFGFINQEDAHASTFLRSTGEDSPNLIEFNYFPDTGFGPTIWPAAFTTNSVMNYNGNQDFAIYELPTEVPLDIQLDYDADLETITTLIATQGENLIPPISTKLATVDFGFGGPFTQFIVDTFAISSYSDEHPDVNPFSGSILANGVIDNIRIVLPPNPISDEHYEIKEGNWFHRFRSRIGWSYLLQRTLDFNTWTSISSSKKGDGGWISFHDQLEVIPERCFYRIVASKEF